MPQTWPPPPQSSTPGPTCDRCDTSVSPAYFRYWCDNDGTLDGCRHCLPRSVRFGVDIYGRDRDEVQASFAGSDPQDRGSEPAPSSRIADSVPLGPDPDYEDFRATTPAALLDGYDVTDP